MEPRLPTPNFDFNNGDERARVEIGGNEVDNNVEVVENVYVEVVEESTVEAVGDDTIEVVK